jgi:hypothetical protein
MGVKRRIKNMQFVFPDVVKYFYGTYVQCGMRDILRSIGLTHPGSNRGNDPDDLVERLKCSVILGYKRLTYTGMVMIDEVEYKIFLTIVEFQPS